MRVAAAVLLVLAAGCNAQDCHRACHEDSYYGNWNCTREADSTDSSSSFRWSPNCYPCAARPASRRCPPGEVEASDVPCATVGGVRVRGCMSCVRDDTPPCNGHTEFEAMPCGHSVPIRGFDLGFASARPVFAARRVCASTDGCDAACASCIGDTARDCGPRDFSLTHNTSIMDCAPGYALRNTSYAVADRLMWVKRTSGALDVREFDRNSRRVDLDDFKCLPCPLPGNCLRGGVCGAGVEPDSKLCAGCKPGFYQGVGRSQCRECPAFSWLHVLPSLFCFGILLLVSTRTAPALRLLTHHAQMVFVSLSLSVPWPTTLIDIAAYVQASAGLDFALYTAECATGGSFYPTFSLALFLSGVCAGAVALLRAWIRWNAGRLRPMSAQALRSFKHEEAATQLLVLLLIAAYVPVSRTLLEATVCYRDGQSAWLLKDPSVSCEGGHIGVIVGSVAVVIGVLEVLPFKLMLKLCVHAIDGVVLPTHWLLRGLSGPFRIGGRAHLTEFVLLMQKGLSVAVAVLVPNGVAQSAVVMLLTGVALVFVTKEKPWKPRTARAPSCCRFTFSDHRNRLAILALASELLLQLLGLVASLVAPRGTSVDADELLTTLSVSAGAAVAGVATLLVLSIALQIGRHHGALYAAAGATPSNATSPTSAAVSLQPNAQRVGADSIVVSGLADNSELAHAGLDAEERDENLCEELAVLARQSEMVVQNIKRRRGDARENVAQRKELAKRITAITETLRLIDDAEVEERLRSINAVMSTAQDRAWRAVIRSVRRTLKLWTPKNAAVFGGKSEAPVHGIIESGADEEKSDCDSHGGGGSTDEGTFDRYDFGNELWYCSDSGDTNHPDGLDASGSGEVSDDGSAAGAARGAAPRSTSEPPGDLDGQLGASEADNRDDDSVGDEVGKLEQLIDAAHAAAVKLPSELEEYHIKLQDAGWVKHAQRVATAIATAVPLSQRCAAATTRLPPEDAAEADALLRSRFEEATVGFSSAFEELTDAQHHATDASDWEAAVSAARRQHQLFVTLIRALRIPDAIARIPEQCGDAAPTEAVHGGLHMPHLHCALRWSKLAAECMQELPRSLTEAPPPLSKRLYTDGNKRRALEELAGVRIGAMVRRVERRDDVEQELLSEDPDVVDGAAAELEEVAAERDDCVASLRSAALRRGSFSTRD